MPIRMSVVDTPGLIFCDHWSRSIWSGQWFGIWIAGTHGAVVGAAIVRAAELTASTVARTGITRPP